MESGSDEDWSPVSRGRDKKKKSARGRGEAAVGRGESRKRPAEPSQHVASKFQGIATPDSQRIEDASQQ